MASNSQVDVTCDKKEVFDMALAIAFINAPGHKAYGFCVDKKIGLILYWFEADKAEPLPYAMDINQAKSFVWGWLESLKDEDFSEYTFDHMSNLKLDKKRGFRIFNEDWGHVNGQSYAFVAILPTYTLYGK